MAGLCQLGELPVAFLQNIERVNVPWSDVWRGSRCSMDTNRCHRARQCALERSGRPIALSDELQVSVGLGTNRAMTALRDSSMSFGEFPAKHRVSGCALEARRMAIAVSDELQESVGPGADGCVWQFGELPANHRAGGCALECCMEGFAVLDGHKSMPSRELMCPGGPWNGDCRAR